MNDYIQWNNLVKGPEILCISTKPNSKPDMHSLSTSGMSVNTDIKMTEAQSLMTLFIITKCLLYWGGKDLLEMKAEILAPLTFMAKFLLTLSLAEFYPSPWNLGSGGSRRLLWGCLSLFWLLIFRLRLQSDV